MPTYAWTAKDKSGASVFREIEAATVGESRDALLAQGYTELRLREDDVLAESSRAFGDKAVFLGEEIRVSAHDRIKYQDQPPLTIVGIILQGLKQNKGFFIIAAVGLAFCVYRHWVAGAIICAVLLVAWPLIAVGIGLPLTLYRRLADADDWNRWNEVLRLVKQLRAVGRYHFAKVPETELTRFEANALAGKGQLSEAVALYSRVENQPGAATWLFKSHLSTIYHNGGDYATALKLMHEAIALKPDGSRFIDLVSPIVLRVTIRTPPAHAPRCSTWTWIL